MGRKPLRERPKKPYGTRLPIEHVDFLSSRENAVLWLERKIDRDREFREWLAKRTAAEPATKKPKGRK